MEKGHVVSKVTGYKDEESGVEHFMFFCPGCECGHGFQTPKWTFNGDMKKPTIRASILHPGDPKIREETKGRYGHRCHVFVTEGKIQFLNDCTHVLKGQTVDLKEL